MRALSGPARLAVIGSCVTRDIWKLPELQDRPRPDLFVSRTSFASLMADPVADYLRPAEPLPAGLSNWEARMIEDDMRKAALGKLADLQPTHLILDLIDERFDLLADGPVVATHSWELHLAGQVGHGPLARLKPLPRTSAEAAALWRRGLERFARFLADTLPDTRVLFHDARWAAEWLDEQGVRHAFDADRMIWDGLPANLHEHNALLAGYATQIREVLPAAFHIRAPTSLVVGDAAHRWGLGPYHYAPDYYRYVWRRLAELGCGAGTPPDQARPAEIVAGRPS